MKRTSTHLATTLQTCDGAVHDACYSALHHRHTAPVSRLNSKHSPQTRLGVDLLASGATGAFLAGAFNPVSAVVLVFVAVHHTVYMPCLIALVFLG
eukprot:m.27984 g.27984  ORF g.27984 m.27984 type:complete len:96 (-) comp11797_c0_seq2:111-398(-)